MRSLLSPVGVVLALWLFAAAGPALAQQAPRPVRIGYLSPASASASLAAVEALRSGLRELGYQEGRNLAIESRWADGRYERLAGLANDLVRSGVDVILATGTPATQSAQRATASIPIVMINVGDAVASGLVASLARPGANVTGFTIFSPELMGKRLELLKECLPGLRRAAVLFNPRNPAQRLSVEEGESAAQSMNFSLERFGVGSAQDLPGAFSQMAAQRVEAIVLTVDSLLGANAKAIAKQALERRIASVGPRDFADAGGLFGYGANTVESYRRAALLVHKIAGGANPADLPVERPTRFELVVNRRTASALGVTLPRALLLRADRVID